jgi:hypothetical protein
LEYFTAIWNILWSFGIFFGHLEYFTAIWYILWPFGIFYGHLVYFMVIWNILPTAIWYILWPIGNGVVRWPIFHRFGIMCQENSGNPAAHRFSLLVAAPNAAMSHLNVHTYRRHHTSTLYNRAARFFLVQHKDENIRNDQKMYQITTRCTIWLSNVPNGH